jgi:hypothetical protein
MTVNPYAYQGAQSKFIAHWDNTPDNYDDDDQQQS